MHLGPTTPLPGNSGVFTGGLIVGFSPRGGEFDIAFLRRNTHILLILTQTNMGNIESAANKEGDLTLGIAPTIRAFDEGGCQIPTTSPLLPEGGGGA